MVRATADLAARRLRCAATEVADLPALFAVADDLLRPMIGYDAAAWATVDPASLVSTSCVLFGVEPDPAREDALFAIEYGGQDVNHYVDLAQQPVPAASLHTATGGEPERSERYRQLGVPAGMTDELRVACTTAGHCWGTVTLLRLAPASPFSDEDVAAAAALAPAVAESVRVTLLRHAAQEPDRLPAPPAVLRVWTDGKVQPVTDTAERLVAGADADVRSAARSLAARARADGHAVARLPAAGGAWLQLHAAPMTQQAGIAVVVEHAQPTELADLIVGALGLTPRERQVAEAVLQGLSTRQIARRLAISPWTVQDHLKAVFAKARVSSRGELAALMRREHYVPRTARGATPGPYGWFLNDPLAEAP